MLMFLEYAFGKNQCISLEGWRLHKHSQICGKIRFARYSFALKWQLWWLKTRLCLFEATIWGLGHRWHRWLRDTHTGNPLEMVVANLQLSLYVRRKKKDLFLLCALQVHRASLEKKKLVTKTSYLVSGNRCPGKVMTVSDHSSCYHNRNFSQPTYSVDRNRADRKGNSSSWR